MEAPGRACGAGLGPRLEQENLAKAAERRQAQSAEPVSVLERSVHLRPQSWRVRAEPVEDGCGRRGVEMSSGAAATSFRGRLGAQGALKERL